MHRKRPFEQNRRKILQFAGATAASLIAGALPLNALAASAAGGKMKIGIVGSGRVGGTVGGLWVKLGHEVMFSSLNLEEDKALAAKLGAGARAGTPREATAFGDVVFISVPYKALPQVGKELADLIKGKIIISSCNPIVARECDMAVAAREKGAGLASAEFLPGARIVRAFNAIGYARLPEAAQQKERYGMPIAGDDQKAIAVASALIREIGYEPVLIGSLAMGRYLIPGPGEPLAGQRSPEEIRRIAATLK